MLDAGHAASGWSDQCWTPARIAEIVRRRFGDEYTSAGLDLLLHRIGWSVQVPSRKAAERNEARIAAWEDRPRLPTASPTALRAAYFRKGGPGTKTLSYVVRRMSRL
ncbi:winged helix-turn-helix domain-containing protein [Streptomyces sp. NPDC002769]|uniref:helix-turn-helix domain-containing protein n=1 Tax=Streptomyces sp. NPDC002769 TaxID=3154542 RepID=UPI0033298740